MHYCLRAYWLKFLPFNAPLSFFSLLVTNPEDWISYSIGRGFQVNDHMQSCVPCHKVLGLSSPALIQCFFSAWELQALPPSCFGWYHPRFPDPKLLETLANSHSCQRHRLDRHRGCWSGKCHPAPSPLSQQPAYKWQLGSHKAWGFSPPSPSAGRVLGPSASCWCVGTEPVGEWPCGSAPWSVCLSVCLLGFSSS